MRKTIESRSLVRNIGIGVGLFAGSVALVGCGSAERSPLGETTSREAATPAGPVYSPDLDIIEDFYVYRKFTPSGKMITVVEAEGKDVERITELNTNDITLSYCDNGDLVEVSYWRDTDARNVRDNAEVCADNKLTPSDFQIGAK